MAIISEKIDGDVINVEIKSSNMKSASYNTKTKVLTVTFNSGISYTYADVPWEKFTAMRLAKSQGVYFNKEIKNTYTYTKVN